MFEREKYFNLTLYFLFDLSISVSLARKVIAWKVVITIKGFIPDLLLFTNIQNYVLLLTFSMGFIILPQFPCSLQIPYLQTNGLVKPHSSKLNLLSELNLFGGKSGEWGLETVLIQKVLT